jgi:hypothetical protein
VILAHCADIGSYSEGRRVRDDFVGDWPVRCCASGSLGVLAWLDAGLRRRLSGCATAARSSSGRFDEPPT